jgi:hypothetical protein
MTQAIYPNDPLVEQPVISEQMKALANEVAARYGLAPCDPIGWLYALVDMYNEGFNDGLKQKPNCETFWNELRERFFKECVDRLLVWPRQFDYSKESNATIIFEWFKSSLNQKQLKGLRSGDWYLNEYGNKITILSVADGWCMVRECDKKPFVVPEEFVLGTFDKATKQ